MDLEDEDLFAVFDTESSKAAKSGVISRLRQQDDQEETTDDTADNASTKPIKFDSGRLVAEICGGGGGANTKRTGETEPTEEAVTKKMKTEAAVTLVTEKTEAVTLMTGLSDQDVERTLKGESDWETQEKCTNIAYHKCFNFVDVILI
jgi:hypothetical protein